MKKASLSTKIGRAVIASGCLTAVALKGFSMGSEMARGYTIEESLKSLHYGGVLETAAIIGAIAVLNLAMNHPDYK